MTLSHRYGLPRFVEGVQKSVEELGGVTSGVAASFEEANITVEVDGDMSEWESEGRGALLVGDHRIGVEYAPLMALLGNHGREDVRFVAKPFSMQARIMADLALSQGVDLTLPVIPGTLAKDRSNKLNRDLYWRMREGGSLPTSQELKKLNANTLQETADLVAKGYAVTIYPAGGVMNAREKPWQRGLGRVVSQLSEEARETATIVPFRFDHFSRLLLIRALHQRSRGKEPKSQTVTMRLGQQGTPNELLGDTIQSQDPNEITEVLRRQFIASFNSERR